MIKDAKDVDSAPAVVAKRFQDILNQNPHLAASEWALEMSVKRQMSYVLADLRRQRSRVIRALRRTGVTIDEQSLDYAAASNPNGSAMDVDVDDVNAHTIDNDDHLGDAASDSDMSDLDKLSDVDFSDHDDADDDEGY